MKYSLLKAMAERLSLSIWLYAVPHWWAVLLALYGGYERQWVDRCVDASKRIHAGASEADVLSVIGPPTARFERRGELASALFGKVSRAAVSDPCSAEAPLFLPGRKRFSYRVERP
jgi:hypothetical protein